MRSDSKVKTSAHPCVPSIGHTWHSLMPASLADLGQERAHYDLSPGGKNSINLVPPLLHL